MGLINEFNNWRSSRYDNHVSQMKELDKCPECHGRGFLLYPAMEFTYQAYTSQCPGCDGTGQYGAWENTR